MAEDLSFKEKLAAIRTIAGFRPKFTAGIVLFSLFTAVFEGIGITFIVPLIEVAQSSTVPDEGIAGAFATAYQMLGVPLTLGSLVIGVSIILVIRYSATFLSEWARINLRVNYVGDLQSRCFENTVSARIAYFDSEGSDDILNAIVTQAQKAGYSIEGLVNMFQLSVLALMYLSIALYLAPILTVVSGVTVGLLVYLLRSVVEPAYTAGDRVAEANERIQRSVQAGTQGIREVKTLGYAEELLEQFQDSMAQYVSSNVKVNRNEAAIGNFNNLIVAIVVFSLVYVSLTFTNLSFGALGAFLFVMFKLGPVVTNINGRYYQLEGMLPHLIRTEEFIDDLKRNRDIDSGDKAVPADPSPIVFDNVSFSYEASEEVLSDISFSIEGGDFVALVGESGGGKSTIASLLARLYVPDSGEISAAWTPISEYDIDEWRARIAYVRQNPFIFNTTLKQNLLIANPDASREEIQRVCKIAQVTEFLDDLPDGLETELGDDGVRLSGGQRQRVALARALLEDADILLLDEATSDLDTGIESRVQQEIETMGRDFTVIAIAHRLSTIKGADRIFTLEDGEIIEKGEHDTLIEQDGRYAELYRAQRTA